MRNSENIGHIILGTVRKLMLITVGQNIYNLIGLEEYNIGGILLLVSILYSLIKRFQWQEKIENAIKAFKP